MESKKKFIAVIGNEKAGKSTVIVSLTGCRNRGYQDMVVNNESKKCIFVIANSPQEEKLSVKYEIKGPEKDVFNHILNKVINKKNCLGLAMTIRPKSNSKEKLSLEDIIQEVQNTKMFDSYLFVLNQAYNPEYNTDFNEINERLNIFELNLLRPLDGRRFAFLSARDINQETQLF